MAYCEVTISWEIISGDLSSAVIYRAEEEQDKSDSTGPSLPTTGLVCAPSFREDLDGQPSDPVPCTLSLSRRSPPYSITIAAVDVLCDARHMEIYTETGEYVQTSKGVSVGDVVEGEHKLYLLQHTFEEPLPKCQLKLLSLNNQDQLWLHSVHITVAQDLYGNTGLPFLGIRASTIDVDKVKEMMTEMGREIPQEARGLLQAMETQQKQRSTNTGNLGPLASMLASLPKGSGESPPNFASMLSVFSSMSLGSSYSGGTPKQTWKKPAALVAHGKDSSAVPEVLATANSCLASRDTVPAGQQEPKTKADVKVPLDIPAGLAGSTGDGTPRPAEPAGYDQLQNAVSELEVGSTDGMVARSALEARLTQRIQEAEARIINTISKHMQQLEDKVMSRLDEAMGKMNFIERQIDMQKDPKVAPLFEDQDKAQTMPL